MTDEEFRVIAEKVWWDCKVALGPHPLGLGLDVRRNGRKVAGMVRREDKIVVLTATSNFSEAREACEWAFASMFPDVTWRIVSPWLPQPGHAHIELVYQPEPAVDLSFINPVSKRGIRSRPASE